MEENYIQMHQLGLASDYASTYAFAYLGAIATMLLPFFVMLSTYMIYKYCQMQSHKARTFEHDADFEPEDDVFNDDTTNDSNG